MKKNKGITLIALVITIIVLLIILGIGIGAGISLNEETTKNKQITELNMVQQAVLEQYTKYKIVKDENKIVGTKITNWTEVNEIVKSMNSNITLKIDESEYNNVKSIEKYYKLGINDLRKIGISNTTDNVYYIVNYTTGEVINALEKTTYNGEPLYIYAVDKN